MSSPGGGTGPTRLWRLPDTVDEVVRADLRRAYEPPPDRPSLRMNFVTSLDGAVTLDGRSRGLSNDVDRMVFGILRAHCDAVLVGAGTVREEGYHALRLSDQSRTWRREQGRPDNPVLVIVSGSLGINPDHAVFVDPPRRPIVLTHGGADPERRAALSTVADVLACGEDSIDLKTAIDELHRRELAHILCEGGGHLFGALQAADLVDELCLTVAPLLAGPGAARIIAGAAGAAVLPMRLVHAIAAGDYLLTRYSRA